MTIEEKNTEKQILEAAKIVFLKKGLDGARMQDIADEAGINKSLLHYYFRSKDNLFETIFKLLFEEFIPRMNETLNTDIPFSKKIEIFVENYIDMLVKNPYLPTFIFLEINRHPEKIVGIMQKSGFNPESFVKLILKDINEGKIKTINPKHLIINILGMCLFPFIARPLIQPMLFFDNNLMFNEFIEERKKEIPKFIMASIENN